VHSSHVVYNVVCTIPGRTISYIYLRHRISGCDIVCPVDIVSGNKISYVNTGYRTFITISYKFKRNEKKLLPLLGRAVDMAENSNKRENNKYLNYSIYCICRQSNQVQIQTLDVRRRRTTSYTSTISMFLSDVAYDMLRFVCIIQYVVSVLYDIG
jgi:hypothetical protein